MTSQVFRGCTDRLLALPNSEPQVVPLIGQFANCLYEEIDLINF
jgi:hypothetical protein